MAEAFFDIILKDISGNRIESSTMAENKTYSADVTDFELKSMKLTAKMCRQNNVTALSDPVEGQELESPEKGRVHINSNFMIKSENSHLYTHGILTRVPLDFEPSQFCPSPTRHRQLIERLPLPAACPTCWSVQRIGYLKPKKPKPVKRCSPNEQTRVISSKQPSCKVKITGPKISELSVSERISGNQQIRTDDVKREKKESNSRKDFAKFGEKQETSRNTHELETRANPKCSKISTKLKNEIEPKSVLVKTRTRTIIPVKFTSL